MASPVGHGLIGLAIARLTRPHGDRAAVWWYAFAVLLANLPDFDFLPGILLGDAGRFHRGVSHSFLAAAFVGLAAAALARWSQAPAWRIGVVSAALYASHLALDLLSEDPTAPVGQPAFWPWRAEPVISPWTPLLGVAHGGSELGGFVASVLTTANILVVGREVALLGPILALVWLAARRPERRT